MPAPNHNDTSMHSKNAIALLLASLLVQGPSCARDITANDGQDKAQEQASDQPLKEIPDNADSKDAAVKSIREFIAGLEIHRDQPKWKVQLPKPPQLTFTPEMDYFWNLQTNKGNIIVRLMPDVAPMHVSSTIYLTELGFYNNTKFHRVIPGFMAQGGCPLGNGRGNPGYKYAGETSKTVKHTRGGLLSMANAGPGTDGSQFFLTFVPTPHLDGKHTIFGEIVEGMGTMTILEKLGTAPRGRTKEPLRIERATFSVRAKSQADKAAASKKD